MSDTPIDSAAVFDLLSAALSGDAEFHQFVGNSMGAEQSYQEAEAEALDWLTEEVHSQIASLDEALTVARILIAEPPDDEGDDE